MNSVRSEFGLRHHGPGLAQRPKRPSRSGLCGATGTRQCWSPRSGGVLRRDRRQGAGGLGEAEPAGTAPAMHEACAWQAKEAAELTGKRGDGGAEMRRRNGVWSPSGELRWTRSSELCPLSSASPRGTFSTCARRAGAPAAVLRCVAASGKKGGMHR
jgi:hypothetical protein